MKIQEILITIVLWMASVAGAFWLGMDHQKAVDAAADDKAKLAIEETRKAANQGAADAISKIVVRNTTVQGRVDTVIRDNPVYRDCQHSPEQLRNINEALTGRTEPIGDSSMSRTDAPQ